MRIHVKPTMECNLECFYCCEKREEGRMSDATVADIVARVGEAVDREGAGVVKFDWSGGEPLLETLCHRAAPPRITQWARRNPAPTTLAWS